MLIKPGAKKFWTPGIAQVYGKAAGGGGGPLTFAWTDSQPLPATPAPPAVFTGKSIGSASSDRVIVVGISVLGAAVSSSMDITTVEIDSGGGYVPMTLGVYARGGSSQVAEGQWFLNVPTGTTANIRVSGYLNGFITTMIINVGALKGSATASVSSTSTGATYSNGTTPTSVTVAANGMGIITALVVNSSSGPPISAYSSATLDKDQSDGASFGSTGSMAHLSSSATVTGSATNFGGAMGWASASYQP